MMKRMIASLLCLMFIMPLSWQCAFSALDNTDEAPGAPDGFDTADFHGSNLDIAATGVTLDDPLIVPRIVVTTRSGNGTALQKDDGYVNAEISITDTDGSVLSDSCSFKVRGNTTAMTFIAKKAYTFKFDKKKTVLGLGSGKKWALLANAFDPTLLRNYMSFELADELGVPYTSNHRFVEVFLDGSYRGCYELAEPVQQAKDRVNIDIESNGGKNDFLLEYEAKRVEEGVTYLTVDGLRFIASEPDEPDEEQLAYIIETMNGIINIMKTGSREEIEAVIDVPTFASFYLLNEFLKTMDFDTSSVYFFYKDGKLYAGPAWDYDMSTGNTNESVISAHAQNTAKSDGIMQSGNNLYRYLCNKSWFMDEVKRTYEEHYDYIRDIFTDDGQMDSLREEYSDLFDRNGSVWRVSKWLYNYQKKPLPTYEENFVFLKNWLNERNSWLYDYWDLFGYEYLRGDADGNGEVDMIDVTVIQRSLAGLPFSDDGHMELRAAVTGDSMDMLDVTVIQRYLALMGNPYELDVKVKTKLREK